jgi:hypothetical protein
LGGEEITRDQREKCSIFLKFHVRIVVNRKMSMLIQVQASSRTGRIARCAVHPF